MLDDFKNEQQIVYKTLINSVKRNRTSHAYLIESNGYCKSLNLAIAFAKYLLCPKSYSNLEYCSNCNQCKNIDKNEFIELKIIDPDGQWIKKAQLEELQELFSRKSIIGNRKVYIINNADRLNTASSNSLLKFLEEPEEGIIAILVAENSSKLLPTIISRCQVLSLNSIKNFEGLSTVEIIANLKKNNDADFFANLSLDEKSEQIKKIIEFIEYFEKNKEKTLLYINKLWNNYFKEREELYNLFSIMILFYKDALNLKLDRKIEVFSDYVNNISLIEKNNTLDEIIKKINVIMNLREKIKFNANSNLLMDKLIIELKGCERQ